MLLESVLHLMIERQLISAADVVEAIDGICELEDEKLRQLNAAAPAANVVNLLAPLRNTFASI